MFVHTHTLSLTLQTLPKCDVIVYMKPATWQHKMSISGVFDGLLKYDSFERRYIIPSSPNLLNYYLK